MPKIDEKKLLFLLIVLHLAIALPLGYYLNVWVDEASTLNTTANGILSALDSALHNESQSPLYFVLLAAWRLLNDSIFWTRVFSTLCSVAAIWFSAGTIGRFVPENAQKFALVIFALHPFLFWASVETRGYSLTILLTALLLRFFYDAFLADDPPLSAQVGYILVAAAGLYTHYFVGFFLVGNFIALVVLRKQKRAAIYLAHMVAVGILFLPLLYAMAGQMGGRHEIGDQSLLLGVRNSWQNIQTLVLPVNLFTDEANILAALRLWLFRVAVLLIGITVVWRKFKGISANTLALGSATATIAIFLVSVVVLLGIGYANIRHTAVLVLPLLLCATNLAYELFGKRGLMAWGAILAVLYPAALVQQSFPTLKRGDWENVAKYIRANENGDQPIVIFDPYDSVAFRIYYSDNGNVLPREGYFNWLRNNDSRVGEPSLKQANQLVSEIPPDAPEVWLLTGEICDLERGADVCRPLEEYFNSRYTIVRDERFYLERVRLYRKNGN